MKGEPEIVASRGTYRLVHQSRDEKSWANMSDLTLERLADDAMGEPHWVYVYSWCLSEVDEGKFLSSPGPNAQYVALKMLLDQGPVTKLA